MHDLIVIDNALTETEADELEKLLSSDIFPYYLGMDVHPDRLAESDDHPGLMVTENAVTSIQGSHICFTPRDPNNSPYDSYAKELSGKILQHIDITNPEFERIKFNVMFPNKHLTKIHHNVPHIDCLEGWVLLYFVNDSDGDTLFFHQRYDGENHIASKVRHRISPQKGKAVVFQSDIFHCSTNPIMSEKRIVMNVNFNFQADAQV